MSYAASNSELRWATLADSRRYVHPLRLSGEERAAAAARQRVQREADAALERQRLQYELRLQSTQNYWRSRLQQQQQLNAELQADNAQLAFVVEELQEQLADTLNAQREHQRVERAASATSSLSAV